MTYEEALAVATANNEIDENQTFLIDKNLRTVTIPDGFVLGVFNDKNVQIVPFAMPRYYNGIDMSTFAIQVNYVNSAGNGDIYLVFDQDVQEDLILFNWVVDRTAFATSGKTGFVVCMKEDDEYGYVAREFNTTLAYAPVLDGLEIDNQIDEQTALDILTQIQRAAERADIAAQQAEDSAEQASTDANTASNAASSASTSADTATAAQQSASASATTASSAATNAVSARNAAIEAAQAAAQSAASLTVDTELSSTSTNPVQNKVIDATVTELKNETTELKSAIQEFTLEQVGANINNATYEGGYINSQGVDTTAASYETVAFRTKDYIPVIGGKSIYWWGYLTDSTTLGANAVIVEYDATKTLIGTRNAFNKYGSSGSSQKFTLSANAEYIRLALYQGVADFTTIKIAVYYEEDVQAAFVPYVAISVVDYEKIFDSNGNDADTIIDNKLGATPIYSKYTITEEMQTGALMSYGTVTQTTDVYRWNIPVTKGEKLLITAQHGYAYRAWLFTDSNGNVLSYYPNTKAGSVVHTNVEQTAPENGYLVLQKVYGYNPTLCKASGSMVGDILYRKKLYFNGDSIAAGAGGLSYNFQIANKHGMPYINDAVSGTYLSTSRTNSITSRILALTSSTDCDFICVEGGFNDYFSNIAIGTLTSNYSDTPDSTTVIGAVETICQHIRTTLSEKIFFFVIGHRPIAVGAYPTAVDTYWDAIISALEKWAVPYVDIRKEGTLMAYNNDWLATYFGTGETIGTHPNELGYKLFYVPLVEAKMKELAR